MENPRSWGPVEQTINTAFVKWDQAQSQGIIGGSLEMTIANALRDAGLIVDSPHG